jgi:tetratricopeptide (TPR) repeat protein
LTTSPGRYAGADNAWGVALSTYVVNEVSESFKKHPNIPTVLAGASLGADLPEFTLPNLVAPPPPELTSQASRSKQWFNGRPSWGIIIMAMERIEVIGVNRNLAKSELFERFLRLLTIVAVMTFASRAEHSYEISGQVQPAGAFSITVFGSTSPFNASTLSDHSGHFSFKNLAEGTYTISIFNPEHGEVRRTVEVGPGTADQKRRVSVLLEFQPADFAFASAMRRDAVSANELAIPKRAVHEYKDAGKALTRRNVAVAVKKLEQAVRVAPQFSAAWNQLGTISYQTRNLARAEQCFRHALESDPKGFEPLVNLGGVMVMLGRTKEALDYNQQAVRIRPNDALANSQLGLAYFQARDDEKALKYLEIARRIDPAHFSHPQIGMAEIHVRMGDRKAAAMDLEDFLKHHPDWPEAGVIRKEISELSK